MAIAIAALTVAIGLVRVTEKLIVYFINKRTRSDNPYSGMSSEQNKTIKESHMLGLRTFEIISQKDQDGTYLCYFPRAHSDIYKTIAELQLKTMEKITELTMEQHRLVDIIERLERRSEK